MVINHAIPTHPFFGIIVPKSYIESPFCVRGEQTMYVKTFFDRKKQKTYNARVHAVSTLTVDEFLSQSIPSLLAYGEQPEQLLPKLLATYKEIRETQLMRYVVLELL